MSLKRKLRTVRTRSKRGLPTAPIEERRLIIEEAIIVRMAHATGYHGPRHWFLLDDLLGDEDPVMYAEIIKDSCENRWWNNQEEVLRGKFSIWNNDE